MTNTWANCEALFDFQPDVKVRGCGETTPHDSGLISETRRWRPVCTHIPHIVRGEKNDGLGKGHGMTVQTQQPELTFSFLSPGPVSLRPSLDLVNCIQDHRICL